MHEIKCPHCGRAFTIDEAGYADIVKQVRDAEFEQHLHERLELAEQDKTIALELAESKAASELQKTAAAKDAAIQELKAKLDAGEVTQKLAVTEALSTVEKERDALANELEQAKQEKQSSAELADAKLVNELQRAAATKDSAIQDLQAKLEAIEIAQRLATTEAVGAVEKERDALANELEQAKQERLLSAELADAKLVNELQKATATKDSAIQDLQAKLEAIEVAQRLAIAEAVSTVEKERDEFKSGLDRAELEKQLVEKSMKDKYETQIKDREEQIERLRDLKTKLSTKMVGETLEQHCETEFNRIRATAFPCAYFEKDNDSRDW